MSFAITVCLATERGDWRNHDRK